MAPLGRGTAGGPFTAATNCPPGRIVPTRTLATIGPGGGTYGNHEWSRTIHNCRNWSPRTNCRWDQLSRDRTIPPHPYIIFDAKGILKLDVAREGYI